MEYESQELLQFLNMKLDRCTFSGCRFTRCNIVSLSATCTQVRYAEFDSCNLIGIHWNELLPAGRIKNPISKLSNSFLKYNSFIHMSLARFQFAGNHLEHSMFEECNLKDSSFEKSLLNTTQFTNRDLRGADFREATGYQIDINTNKLKGAKFSFPEVINLLSGLEINID